MGTAEMVETYLTPNEMTELNLDRFKRWYEGDPRFARGVREIVANGE